MQFSNQVFFKANILPFKSFKTMTPEKSILTTWFLVAATVSSIPLLLEYSKVQRKYEIIKVIKRKWSEIVCTIKPKKFGIIWSMYMKMA